MIRGLRAGAFALFVAWGLSGAALSLAVLAVPAQAVEPDEVLPDAALEARARDLSAGLRCLVCQNQSIDDSDADLAKDLRLLVRERLVAGDTDGEVIDYLVSRYGEFVLLRPRVDWTTIALWGAPAALLGGGAIVALLAARRRRTSDSGEVEPLGEAEERALAEMLERRGR